MIALVVGLIIGFLMCIPIGPINVWVMNIHLKKGASRSLAIALGGSVMDFTYFFFILSGLSFIQIQEGFLAKFKAVGIILIFILGLKELLTKSIEWEEPKEEKKSTSKVIAAFLLGVALYTSNPTLIITMSGLAAFVKSLGLFSLNIGNIVLVSLGLSIGSFLWFLFLVKVVDRYREKIKTRYYKYFVRTSGGLMIGLSLFMGTRLILAGS